MRYVPCTRHALHKFLLSSTTYLWNCEKDHNNEVLQAIPNHKMGLHFNGFWYIFPISFQTNINRWRGGGTRWRRRRGRVDGETCSRTVCAESYRAIGTGTENHGHLHVLGSGNKSVWGTELAAQQCGNSAEDCRGWGTTIAVAAEKRTNWRVQSWQRLVLLITDISTPPPIL